MPKFKFDMHAAVKLSRSNEHGEVVGRAQYASSGDTHLVI